MTLELVVTNREPEENEPSELMIQYAFQAAAKGHPRRLIAAACHVSMSVWNGWLRRASTMDGSTKPPTENMRRLWEALQLAEVYRTDQLLESVNQGAMNDPKLALMMLERTVPEFARKVAIRDEIKTPDSRESLVERLKALAAGGSADSDEDGL